MLHALENLLRAAIEAALPDNKVDVIAGPYTPAGNGAVVVHARSLAVELPPADGEDDDPAHRVELVTWNAEGTTVDFAIPAAHTGELLEVEAPPGTTVRAGDAYYLQDRTIRFYRPPAPAAPSVRARLRGSTAAGWHRRRGCAIQLDIAAWAQRIDIADVWLQTALQTALAVLVDAPNLEADQVAGADVWLRALAPRPWLQGMRRGTEPGLGLVHATAELLVRAELDEVVARGVPAPAGYIERIDGTLDVDRADGAPPAPEPFTVKPAPGALQTG